MSSQSPIQRGILWDQDDYAAVRVHQELSQSPIQRGILWDRRKAMTRSSRVAVGLNPLSSGASFGTLVIVAIFFLACVSQSPIQRGILWDDPDPHADDFSNSVSIPYPAGHPLGLNGITDLWTPSLWSLNPLSSGASFGTQIERERFEAGFESQSPIQRGILWDIRKNQIAGGGLSGLNPLSSGASFGTSKR